MEIIVNFSLILSGDERMEVEGKRARQARAKFIFYTLNKRRSLLGRCFEVIYF